MDGNQFLERLKHKAYQADLARALSYLLSMPLITKLEPGDFNPDESTNEDIPIFIHTAKLNRHFKN